MSSDAFLSVTSRGVIALPVAVRRRHGLDKPGSQLKVVERDDGVIELHPHFAVPADQAWFWSARWQKMEREADADIAKGRVEDFDSADAFLDRLDSL